MPIDLDALRQAVSEFDEGELSGAHEFSIWEPTPGAANVVVTTKRRAAARLLDAVAEENWPAIVGHYGLPAAKDVAWLRSFLGDRRTWFLGDGDPFDLLVFAAWRDHLPMDYLGINDGLLTAFDFPFDDRWTIPLCPIELRAMEVLRDVYPAYRSLLGPRVAALWDVSRKLELEAVVSCRRNREGNLLDLIR